MTRVAGFNRAVASRGGETLVLNQPTWLSGLSTLLDQKQVPWLAEAAAEKALETHEVLSTKVSDEIAAHGSRRSTCSRSTWRVISSRC